MTGFRNMLCQQCPLDTSPSTFSKQKLISKQGPVGSVPSWVVENGLRRLTDGKQYHTPLYGSSRGDGLRAAPSHPSCSPTSAIEGAGPTALTYSIDSLERILSVVWSTRVSGRVASVHQDPRHKYWISRALTGAFFSRAPTEDLLNDPKYGK